MEPRPQPATLGMTECLVHVFSCEAIEFSHHLAGYNCSIRQVWRSTFFIHPHVSTNRLVVWSLGWVPQINRQILLGPGWSYQSVTVFVCLVGLESQIYSMLLCFSLFVFVAKGKHLEPRADWKRKDKKCRCSSSRWLIIRWFLQTSHINLSWDGLDMLSSSLLTPLLQVFYRVYLAPTTFSVLLLSSWLSALDEETCDADTPCYPSMRIDPSDDTVAGQQFEFAASIAVFPSNINHPGRNLGQYRHLWAFKD